MQRALAEARAAVDEDRARKGGRWLALVPVTIAVVLFLLMMPWATEPEAVPLPAVDEAKNAATRREDIARADWAEANRLPDDILAVGTALRGLNTAISKGGDEEARFDARHRLDAALQNVWSGAKPDEAAENMLRLRAVQTKRFVDEVVRYESSGQVSTELVDLAGGFVDRMAEAGWLDGKRLVLSDSQRRAAYKTMWNAATGLETAPPFRLTLDEQRALYSLYLQHPHPPESRRSELDAQRRAASTPEACSRAVDAERRSREGWRIEKIQKLRELDPSYPADYALGVAYYRAGQLDLSVRAFRTFVDEHHDGPLSLRARNHLKYTLVAYGAM